MNINHEKDDKGRPLPPIGSQLHLWPNHKTGGYSHDLHKPFAAFVTFPHKNGEVNVTYFDHRGDHWRNNGVLIVWPGEPKPDDRCFCTIPGLTTVMDLYPGMGVEEKISQDADGADMKLTDGFDASFTNGNI